MLGEKLSEALGGISDGKVQAAAEVYDKKRKKRTVWFRAAAVAATIAIVLSAVLWQRNTEEEFVTAPGILKVYAYDVTSGTTPENMVSYELEEGTISAPLWWCPALSYIRGLPITLKVLNSAYSEMEITMDISSDCGEFYGHPDEEKYKDSPLDYIAQEKLGSSFTINDGETIFWSLSNSDNLEALCAAGGFYVDVIIRAESNIVGCAVIKVVSADDMQFHYSVGDVKTLGFPPVDGEFQNVTEEYVQQELAKMKQS